MFRKIFFWKTRVGTFYIAERGGRYHPIFDDEDLGSYASPQLAAEDLAHGHTSTVCSSVGQLIDTATLGIPPHVGEWGRCGR
jgi:hypothetical protein